MKTLIKSILIPLFVGILASLITGGGMEAFAGLEKPPLAPPGWLFPVVWTILYILMGIASYFIVSSDAEKEQKDSAISAYTLQLIANFLWPVFFFGFEWYLFSAIWLILLLVLIGVTIVRFYEISPKAAYLLLPYLLWVTFAGYLNIAIWWLN